MTTSLPSEIEKFHRELEMYRSIAKRNKDRLEEDSWLAKQLSFWMESTRFLISELEVWDQMRNPKKCEETVRKIQKTLDRLYELVRQLT